LVSVTRKKCDFVA